MAILTHSLGRKPSSVYTRALARAIEIAGGPAPLAAFLGSSVQEVGKWLSGETCPPMPIFLALVDILAANALTAAALDNLPIARARRSSGAASSG